MRHSSTIKTIFFLLIIGCCIGLKAQEHTITMLDNSSNGCSVTGDATYEDYFTVLDSPRVTVIAEYYPDPFDPNSPYVRIYWQGYGSYRVFRSDCYDTSPTMIAQNITSGEYIDSNWGNLEPGIYKYGVRINTEAISWSNCLDKDAYSNMVSITVTMGDGHSPEGTTISFLNHNTVVQELYPVAPITLDETGYYMWDVFRNGNYQITISKSGYETIVDEVTIGEDYYSMSYTLIPPNAYHITVSANPDIGGTVTGGGYYQQGTSCTVTATANDDYSFTNWTENGNIVSTDASYTFNVTGNRALVAHFAQQYTINVSADPTNGGTVTGGGTYQEGQSCTVSATPAHGYTFLRWTVNDNEVSTNTSYTFIVSGNRTLVAHFTQQYTIDVSADPTNGGTVTGGGTYQQGQSCTVSATPAHGYTFLRWTVDDDEVSTNASYTFNVTGNRTLVAHFTQQYTIDVSANPTNGGTVTGGGSYQQGQSCTVSATPANGYTFLRWTENDDEVSTNASYTFNVTGNRTLVAQFAREGQYTVFVDIDPLEGGTVTGDGVYNYGEVCTLNAFANLGYTFVNWTLGDAIVSNNSSYTFTVTETVRYVAHFEKKEYTITVTANPEEGGTVTQSGDGQYYYGITCTLTAEPNDGYTFSNWTDSEGVAVSTDNPYSFVVRESSSFTANFIQNFTYCISASTSSHGTISPEGEIRVEPGGTVTFTMTPDEGCKMYSLIVDGYYCPKMESITFYRVNRNHTIEALFDFMGIEEDATQTIKISPNPAKDKVSVECPRMRRITLFNLAGLIVYDYEVHDDSALISIDGLSPGLYLMKVMTEQSRYHYSKLIITE